MEGELVNGEEKKGKQSEQTRYLFGRSGVLTVKHWQLLVVLFCTAR